MGPSLVGGREGKGREGKGREGCRGGGLFGGGGRFSFKMQVRFDICIDVLGEGGKYYKGPTRVTK